MTNTYILLSEREKDVQLLFLRFLLGSHSRLSLS